LKSDFTILDNLNSTDAGIRYFIFDKNCLIKKNIITFAIDNLKFFSASIEATAP